ncbi:Hypp2900 [Branchiostoma lanceolatum]|uniref:Hypp2900 protein n=1 Tax=Branchiostoma lanceolatum TaxID=7740 RepID=A0A8J9ZV35_BRALA|nr:Hypp2900 [Branchiostoma lanceolatum]
MSETRQWSDQSVSLFRTLRPKVAVEVMAGTGGMLGDCQGPDSTGETREREYCESTCEVRISDMLVNLAVRVSAWAPPT